MSEDPSRFTEGFQALIEQEGCPNSTIYLPTQEEEQRIWTAAQGHTANPTLITVVRVQSHIWSLFEI